MAEYKVVFEIQVDAESPLEAAKTVEGWLKEPGARYAYVVQQDDDKEDSTIYFVGLEEEEEDAVLQVADYRSLIS